MPFTIANDEDCLLLLQKGDATALQHLIRIYFPVICRYAKKFLPDSVAEAEDATEEVFIKLWQHHNKFTHFNAVKKFLYVSTRNACLNILRDKHKEKSKQYDFSQWCAGAANSSLDEVLYSELIIEVRKAVDGLPQRVKEVLILSYFHKLPNKEIALRLNISHQTVRNQKTKGLALLRYILKKHDFEFILLIAVCGLTSAG